MQTMTLNQMKSVDIRAVNPDDLVDLRDIKIDLDMPQKERKIDYIRQIGNPYCYKVGKVAVKVSFDDNGPTLEDKLQSLMLKL